MKQRAAKGEGEAQFSQGRMLVDAGGQIGTLGAGRRLRMVDVGLALFTYAYSVTRWIETRRCSYLI